MNSLAQFFSNHYHEILYQLTIVVVLFIFFSHNQEGTEQVSMQALFASSKLAFFANYMMGAMVINYLLLPILYYKKKPFLFVVSVALLLVMVVLIDEFLLERIYFPDTRGTYFPGIPYTIIETLPIILIFTVFKFAWDFHRKEREVDQLKSLVQESEIKYLKSQVNPHFLFNNLNNLYSKALKNSPKTPGIILELSSVLRFMVYDSKEKDIALSREIEHLRHYTSLYNLQMENRGRVNFEVDLESDQFAISPLLLVIFVENAFKHSTRTQSAGICIQISVRVTSVGQLTFVCENSYSREYQTVEADSGVGLDNVRKRLLLVYPNNHKLNIANDGQTFKVDLQLQLKPSEL